jgi:hypothetical protein
MKPVHRDLLAALVIVILVFIATLSVQTNIQLAKQLEQQKDIVSEIKKDNAEQLGRLNRHLDCIVAYFGQHDRANLTIEDINKCAIKGTDGAQQYFLQAVTPAPVLNPSPKPQSQSGPAPQARVAATPAPTPQPTIAAPKPSPTPTSQPSVVERIISSLIGLLK